MAIGELGGKLLADFDTDTTEVANLCRLWYPIQLKMLLEDMPYTFATNRIELVAHLQDAPVWGGGYAYQLPEDFIQIIDVEPRDSKWKIEGNRLLTPENSLGIVYVFSLQNTAQMSGHFVMALAAAIAVHLVMPITRNIKYVETYEKRYQELVLMSRGRDSQQESRQTYESSILVDVRL